MKRSKPFAYGQMIDLVNRRSSSLFVWCVVSREVLKKLFEVDSIVTKSVRADVAFVLQMFEELVEEILHRTIHRLHGTRAGAEIVGKSLVNYHWTFLNFHLRTIVKARFR